MKINLETAQDGGAFFVSFTHVRDGENYHAFIRLEDIKSWESIVGSGSHDRSSRWRLKTRDGDCYYTLSNFHEIMTTTQWYPRDADGKGMGRVGDERLYRAGE
jgi:hypothetical protein